MQLHTLLRQRIARYGPMPFRRFMEAALYEPGLGYYAGSSTRRAGRAGDFYTSVSVGPLFGECLARQFAEMWRMAGSPPSFWLAEQGAMDGRLALDVLTGLRVADSQCFAAARMALVDPFRPIQNASAAPDPASDLADKIVWLTKLDKDSLEAAAFSAGHPLDFAIVYSNELIDAFPVCLIRYEGGAWKELHIVAEEAATPDAFQFVPLPPATPGLVAAIARLSSVAEDEALPAIEGYTTEINLEAAAWIRQASEMLPRGYVVTIDYGLPRRLYYSVERREGTLRCFRQHRSSNDPLAHVGRQDITADVDFTTLAEEGLACGLHTEGFVDQQRFLMGNAPPLFSMQPGAADVPPETVKTRGYQAQLRAWQSLTHPAMMGAKFHVLIQSKGMQSTGGAADGGGGLPLSGLRFARPVTL
ncbi:MAG TPA: SAM-dependent methyltransferase [Candidatus Methylacidiphilales bacterium]|nr:SAM-dependent methyltransferase [Candidatus Methylacidiphilales bacterium]